MLVGREIKKNIMLIKTYPYYLQLYKYLDVTGDENL